LLNDPKKAVELLNRGLASDPASSTARAERGYARFKLGDYPGTRADLEDVLKRRRDSPGVLCLLSDVLTRLGDFSEAASVAERLLRVDPEHHHAYVVLGRARFRTGAIREGVEALNLLLPCDDFRQVRLGAVAALEAQQLDLAQTLINRAVEIRPEDPSIGPLQGRLQLEVLKEESSRRALAEPLSGFLRAFERKDLLRQREDFVKGIAVALATSVRTFGPLYLAPCVSVLRNFAAEAVEEGLLGQILTGFLSGALRELKGPWEAWRSTLNALRAEVGERPDCEIPLAFLEAALGFKETNDARHLLQLPLELRQLLEEALLEPGKGKH
jgi:tetratricopeptide (TPR) repeat protein